MYLYVYNNCIMNNKINMIVYFVHIRYNNKLHE